MAMPVFRPVAGRDASIRAGTREVKVQTDPFRKVKEATAQEICRRVDLSQEAKAFLLPSLSPQGFLALLAENKHIGDAVRFLAFALPIREAIWWACVTVGGNKDQLSAPEADCVQRATAWVYEPGDARRRACMEAAEGANLEGAAAYAALAVFWSGGSLAPANMPEALPDASLGAIGVGASVLLAITGGEPQMLDQRFEAAMLRGMDIANGGNGRLKSDRPATNVER
jgi:hypothetical protein